MKYFLIAGEASGDLHGSNLMKAILQKDPEAEFQYWGGDLMEASAPGLLQHFKEVTIMGFVEVLMNLRTISRNLKTCKEQISAFSPDVVICIDYPGFNLRIAAYCKEKGFPVHYYIAPKVWAWKENRAKLLEKYVDELIIVFPFEIEYFKKWKVKTTYVGNPLTDALPIQQDNKKGETSQVIALLPGSRKQEISRTLPIMLKALKKRNGYKIVIAGAPGIDSTFYTPFLTPESSIVYGQTYKLLQGAKAAIVCSGTATLETALLNVPQVCVYATSPITYKIAQLLVHVPFISLVNLCLGRSAIREMVQDEFTISALEIEIDRLLDDSTYRKQQLQSYEDLRHLLGDDNASGRAAEVIIGAIKK